VQSDQISAHGISIDFVLLNALGYYSLQIYNMAGLTDPSLGTGYVALQDFAWGLNGFLITSFVLMQTWIYKSGDQKVKLICIGLLMLEAMALSFIYIVDFVNSFSSLISSTS